MKKIKFQSVCIVLLGILSVVLLFVALSTGHILVFANELNESKVKIHCSATMDDKFTEDSVIVILDSKISRINKEHKQGFFRGIEIENIVDLTKREINKTSNNADFRQILQLYLKNSSKEKVLQTIAKLEQIDGIYSAEPNYLYEPTAVSDDPYFTDNSQWNLNGIGGINVPLAWDITTGSREIRVGVIDSGIANHPDLNDNLVEGKDFYNNNTTTTDDYEGHGTNVAGIIGAVGNNATGVAGINWNITLVPLQVGYYDSAKRFYFSTNSIIGAINWATELWGTEQQIDILNYSGGGFGDSPSILQNIREYQGLFVWSAGNNGVGVNIYKDIDLYSLDNLISVGAIDNSNERSVWSSNRGSNYGSAVNIFAPGGKGNTDNENIPTTNNSGGYSYFNGTSAAAPHVTGVAALLLSKNPNLTAAELKEFILKGADEIPISIPLSPYTQDVKKLNAYEAVKFDKVILDKNGGTGGDDYVYVKYGEDMPAATAPTRAGYRFKGYFKDDVMYYDSNMKSVRQWDKTQATTLIAGWDKEYTITFKIDGDTTGEYTFVKDKVCYGDKWPAITMPPARTGYFVGQYIDVASGKTYYDRYGLPRYDTFTFTKDITLVGSWVANTYNVVVSYIQWYSDTATRISAYTARYYENLTFTADESMTVNNETRLFSFWSVIRGGQAYYDYNTNPWHEISYERSFSVNLAELVQKYYPDLKENEVLEFRATFNEEEKKCVAEGTLITLANGEQVPVEQLTGDETLLVWNLFTGTFDTAPILFIDSDPLGVYEVINLYFSDGTTVKVISEHGFWDLNLNEYVYLGNDASQYIGHWFNKQTTDKNNELSWTAVQLTDVVIREEYTTAWSPVTYGHLCYYVNGMLSMPGGIEGLFNIFEVDSETLKYNEAAYLLDIETYGLYTYEEFSEVLPVSKELFEAVNGQYLKVAIGKGLIDLDTIVSYISKYSVFFD